MAERDWVTDVRRWVRESPRGISVAPENLAGLADALEAERALCDRLARSAECWMKGHGPVSYQQAEADLATYRAARGIDP